MFFESISTGILKLLVAYRFIICPGLLDDEESAYALDLALLATFWQVIQTFYNFQIESESLEEQFAFYIAVCFNAKLTWIPFMAKMPQVSNDFESRAINYSNMTCHYGYLTNKFGILKTISYQFSDSSMDNFTSYMRK